jgi:ubiquinone/menaquinone biosynthesis C-methylase UbiE
MVENNIPRDPRAARIVESLPVVPEEIITDANLIPPEVGAAKMLGERTYQEDLQLEDVIPYLPTAEDMLKAWVSNDEYGTADIDRKMEYMRAYRSELGKIGKWDGETLSKSWAYKMKHMLVDNLEAYYNKRILDIGCGDGLEDLAYIKNGASYLVGMDSQGHRLDTARLLTRNLDNCRFVEGDLYDLNGVKALCSDIDTVVLGGVLHHVSNHYQLLEAISSTDVMTLMLETVTHMFAKDRAFIRWRFERTDIVKGARDSKGNTSAFYTGIPNKAFIIEALTHLGWDIAYSANTTGIDDIGEVRLGLVIRAERKQP